MFRGLYAIADVRTLLDSGHTVEDGLRALVDAGVGVLQLRWKGGGAAEVLEAARALVALCREAGVLSIVNDRVDVAALTLADGVHLGQEDLPVEAARALLPKGAVVGVSTHTPAQVEAALAAGADYLGYGPVYDTATKERPDAVVGVEGLAEAVRLAGGTPVVAIGGITLERVPEVARTGAAAAAVIGDVLRGPGIRGRALAVHRAFLRARSE